MPRRRGSALRRSAQPPATRSQKVRPSSSSRCTARSAVGGPCVTDTARTSSASRDEPSGTAGLGQLAVGLPPQLDPVADVQPGALAALLDQPYDVADETGPAQLRGDLEVERHGLAGAARDRPAGARRLGDDDLVLAQAQLLAVDRDTRRAVDQRVRELGAVEGVDRVGDLLRPLAEALAQRPEVGLHRHVDQVAGEALERDDVELGGDQCAQLGRQRLPPGGAHQGPGERLPGLGLGLGAGRPAEVDQPSYQGHLPGQLGRRPASRRPSASRAGAPSRAASRRRDERVPHLVGEERRERRHQPRHDLQALVQRRERGRVAVPEAAARAADVPVRQVVDELGEALSGAQRVEVLQRGGHVEHRGVGLRQRPPVEQGALARLLARRPVVGVGVQGEEGRGVPVGEQDLADDLLERSSPTRRAAQGLPPQSMYQRSASAPCRSISSNGSSTLPRCLLILPPVLGVQDVPEAEHGLVRRPVEHQRPDRHQRVEPAAGLVDRLGR